MSGYTVLATPKWLVFLRYAQIVLAVIVLAISAYGVSIWAFDAYCLAIFVSLATVIIVLYNILTVSLPKWNSSYNYWAVLALDIFGVVFWLSSMAAIASLRTSFNITITIFKRSLEKRYLDAASKGYLAAMSLAAAISAFNFILFVITLVFTGIALHKARTEGSATTATDDSKLESHGMEAVQQPPPPANYGGAPPPANYQQGPPPPANY